MKVLFIGGTGVISEAVSRLAVAKGIDLYLLNRGNRKLFIPEGAKLIQGDIREPQTVSPILKEHYFDAVVDWIVFHPEHLQTDLELFKDRTRQYIFISSTSAYQKPVRDYRMTESTPLANPYWQYSRDKIACEQLLMDQYRRSGFPATIVRPSYTYGNTKIPASVNCSKQPWSLVDRIRKGKKIIIHGDGTSLWVMTHNSDFAKGFVGLLGNQRAIGHAFHITSDEVLSWNQIYESIGAAAGCPIHPVYIPSDFLATVIPDAAGNLWGDKAPSSVFDTSKIKHFVPDYVPTMPFAVGIKKTVEWFEAHPEYCTVDAEWDRMIDRIITEYEAATRKAIERIRS